MKKLKEYLEIRRGPCTNCHFNSQIPELKEYQHCSYPELCCGEGKYRLVPAAVAEAADAVLQAADALSKTWRWSPDETELKVDEDLFAELERALAAYKELTR